MGQSNMRVSGKKEKARGVRILCAQDTQDLFPGRQGTLGLESRRHSERSSAATDGHFEREAVLPAGRERHTHEEKGAQWSQCRTVKVSSLRFA